MAMKRLALVFAAALMLPGCFWSHDAYPGRACQEDSDCFQAQGEVCDTQTNRCVQAGEPDAALPPADGRVDAPPTPDAAAADAPVTDAPTPDAPVSDAGIDAL